MILFVFEGANREPEIFESIEATFFDTPRDGNRIVYSYNTNIYGLYAHMQRLGSGADIVDCIQARTGNPEAEIMRYRSEDFAETYLFFDYDFHHHATGQPLDIDENIRKVREMAGYFDDETGNGKLYVNYPMIESLNYTRNLPDTRYCGYSVNVENSKQFKKLSSNFSAYGNYNHLSVSRNGRDAVKRLWGHLIIQNVVKGVYIGSGTMAMREHGSRTDTLALHDAQIRKYGKEEVGILNSFPLFLYDYFKRPVLSLKSADVRKYVVKTRIRRFLSKFFEF